MISLEPFTRSDFEVFKSWVNNAEELFQFAGPIFSYPLTDEQLMDYINMPNRKPLKVVLIATNETIGHCELNFTSKISRLSRIVIGRKDLRGQNIGETVVRKMVDLLFMDSKTTTVDLNVFSWNKAAIRCYEKVGFEINHDNTDTLTINGESWTRLNMILQRQ